MGVLITIAVIVCVVSIAALIDGRCDRLEQRISHLESQLWNENEPIETN